MECVTKYATAVKKAFYLCQYQYTTSITQQIDDRCNYLRNHACSRTSQAIVEKQNTGCLFNWIM